MSKRDVISILAISAFIVAALFPTLTNIRILQFIPVPYWLLYVFLPLFVLFGMFVANLIGKKVPVLWQIAKFALVGVSNTAIDFGVLNLLAGVTSTFGGFGIAAINVVSFLTALFNSYFWNKSWTFSSKKKNRFLPFFLVTLVGIFINTATVYFLTNFVLPTMIVDERLRPNIAKVFATALSMVWNFLGYKIFVFK